tara:strand:- start:995 stop:1873 length:879 start_codon:yes stop_codon:yes gene_type:complete
MSNTLNRKGIILAGGKGTRLFPITQGISKQLVPVYDKPMIYYPLTTLMKAGIKEILIISKSEDLLSFRNLLKDGNQFGISIKYAIQEQPRGIAEAFIIGDSFIEDSPVALVLGDNLFNGEYLDETVFSISNYSKGATIFAYSVKDPENYGVAEFDSTYKVVNIEEKPKIPKTNWAITGLYFYDNSVVQRSKSLTPSKRGELEITDLNLLYLKDRLLQVELMRRGTAWLDTGNPDSLHEASSYIKTLEQRQGLKVGCPEETAWSMGLINDYQLEKLAKKYSNNYGNYLMNLIR